MDNNLDKKEDMLEREPLEEAIDGSMMDSESESEPVDSVAPASAEEGETEETDTETKDGSATKEVDEAAPETESEVNSKKAGAEEESSDDKDSDAEHKIDISRAKWYTIRTFSGQEKKIRDSLIANIHREGMDDRIFEVLVPTENVVEMRDGKKRSRVKVFFPGYVLIQMDLDKETRFLIEDTYGVLNFIGPGNNPQEIKEKELKRILGDTEKSKAKDLLSIPYIVGDSIKVVDGPFNDFSGYVQEINQEKQKVKVMVSIFGRATPVELDFLQVALEK